MKRPGASDGRASFVQDALRLITNRFLVMVVSFATGVVLARSLGAEGRGLIAALLVYPTLFLSFTEMGVRQSAVFYLGKQAFTDQQVVGAVSTLILGTSVLGVTLVAAFMLAIGNEAFTPLFVVLAVATIPLTLVTDYSSGIMLGKRLVGQFAKIQAFAEVLRLAAVITLVWFLATGVPGALAAAVLANLLIALYALWRVSRVAPLVPSFDWTVVRALLTKGISYAVALFVLTLNYKVNIALMERLSTPAEIGILTIAVGVAQLTWALPQSLTTALFSHSANAKDENAFSQKVARLFRVTVVLSGLLVTLLAALAPAVIPAVYGQQFADSVRPLHLLLPGVFCLLALKVLNMDLAGRGRPNVSLWVTVPALVVNVALNLILLPDFGAKGAAVASSISYSLAGIGLMFIYCHVTGVSLSELWRYRRSDFDFLRGVVPARLLARVQRKRD